MITNKTSVSLRSGLLLGSLLFLGLQPAAAATLKGHPNSGSKNQSWGSLRAATEADAQAIAVYRSGGMTPSYETNFTNPAALQAEWQIKSDDNRDAKSCRRPENVVATGAGLRLRTLAATNCHAAWSTGTMVSNFKQKYGFFEATIKIADIGGMNNAFWLTTDDNFEIDIVEARHPSYIHLGLQNWPLPNGKGHTGMGIGANFVEDLSRAFHEYGILWTPTEIVYEVDGQPIGAFATHSGANGEAAIRFSTMLADWAGKVPDNPVGHDMVVQSLRVYPLHN